MPHDFLKKKPTQSDKLEPSAAKAGGHRAGGKAAAPPMAGGLKGMSFDQGAQALKPADEKTRGPARAGTHRLPPQPAKPQKKDIKAGGHRMPALPAKPAPRDKKPAQEPVVPQAAQAEQPALPEYGRYMPPPMMGQPNLPEYGRYMPPPMMGQPELPAYGVMMPPPMMGQPNLPEYGRYMPPPMMGQPELPAYGVMMPPPMMGNPTLPPYGVYEPPAPTEASHSQFVDVCLRQAKIEEQAAWLAGRDSQWRTDKVAAERDVARKHQLKSPKLPAIQEKVTRLARTLALSQQLQDEVKATAALFDEFFANRTAAGAEEVIAKTSDLLSRLKAFDGNQGVAMKADIGPEYLARFPPAPLPDAPPELEVKDEKTRARHAEAGARKFFNPVAPSEESLREDVRAQNAGSPFTPRTAAEVAPEIARFHQQAIAEADDISRLISKGINFVNDPLARLTQLDEQFKALRAGGDNAALLAQLKTLEQNAGAATSEWSENSKNYSGKSHGQDIAIKLMSWVSPGARAQHYVPWRAWAPQLCNQVAMVEGAIGQRLIKDFQHLQRQVQRLQRALRIAREHKPKLPTIDDSNHPMLRNKVY